MDGKAEANTSGNASTNSWTSGRGRGRGGRRRGDKGRGRGGRGGNTTSAHKSKKKPTFIGLSHDKVKAVLADEPGLDPLSTQLEKLEKELIAYASATMSARVAKSLRSLKVYDFDTSDLMPKPLDPARYTTATVVNQAQKSLLESILNSEVTSFVKTKTFYKLHMEQIFGIIEGNIDDRVRSLINSESTCESVLDSSDPVKMIELLRTACRKKKGVDYPVNAFITSLTDLLTCTQGSDSPIEFMEKIKLKYDIVTSQFGTDWIPTQLKDSVIDMHPETSWSGSEYEKCNAAEQKKLDSITKDRTLANIGVLGYTTKIQGGILLKDHINNNAAVNNNASVCYPNDIPALLRLTTSLVEAKRRPALPRVDNNDTAGSPQPEDQQEDGYDADKKKGLKREGVQFAQTDAKAASDPGPTTTTTGGATGAPTKKASNLLMSSYTRHNDSAQYGRPHFFQTGHVQTPCNTNTWANTAEWEDDMDDAYNITYTEPDDDSSEDPQAIMKGTKSDQPPINYKYSEAVLAQFDECGTINPNWILLDSGSSIHLFTNTDLLSDIGETSNGEHVIINTSAGSVVTNLQGTLDGFGQVWVHPEGIANVLSLGLVSSELRTTMDTTIDNAIFVHKTDGAIRRFGLSSTGLYYSDINDYSGTVLTITTTKDQEMKYSALDMRRARAARNLQHAIANPTTTDLINIVEKNLLKDCGTTRRNIMIAEDVFGPSVPGLKGKTTTPKTVHVREDITPVPSFILEKYNDITLCIDIFIVNKIPFVTTLSRHIYFTTAEAVANVLQTTLTACIRGVIKHYNKRGLRVGTIVGDNQFNCINEDIEGAQFIPLAKGEHEKFIERNNRFVKERCRCLFHNMPFKKIPKQMTIRLVYTAVFWINSFPRQQGVSDTMSPRLILTGQHTSIKHAKHQFGQYFQTHEQSKNDLSERSLDALYAGPLGNSHGGFCAINLKTGREIKRTKATIIHTTPAIVVRVHWLAARDKIRKGLHFRDRNGEAIAIQDLDYPDANISSSSSDESDTDFVLDTDYDSSSTDNSSQSESSDDNENDNYYNPIAPEGASSDSDDNTEPDPANDIDNNSDDTPPLATDSEGIDSNEDYDGDDDIDNNYEDEDDDSEYDDDEADNNEIDDNEIDDNPTIRQILQDDTAPEEEITYEPETHENEEVDDTTPEEEVTPATRTLGEEVAPARSHRAATYIHPVTGARKITYTRGWAGAMDALEYVDSIKQFTSGHANKNGLIDYIQKDSDDHQTFHKFVNHMLFTQHGIKKGLQVFQEEGEEAVLKELQQMHDLEVVEPLNPSEVTKEMTEKALNYLMFLKRKRTGTVKARGCADGRKQKAYVKKEDSAAPTVSLPALILSCLQDAIGHREVATTDIPGAFLQTDQPADDEVIIRFDGPMVEALAQIDPSIYRDKIRFTRRGGQVLYARAKKAIYGTVRAAYLFWLKLSGCLKKWGFVPNPYDQCTVNRMFGKHQCTIQWHVDDLKISCKSKGVVDSVLKRLDKYYGTISPITTTRGKVHEYLGMTIDYSIADKVKITMYNYVNEIIESLPPDMRGLAATPARGHLFRVNPEAVKLDETTADLFHHYTAKLLFIAKRARPDLQTAVAFLCTRVRSPDTDDYKKLACVMKYIQQFPHLPLIIGSDGKGNIYWSVDASFAVHNDMRGHTGAHMSLGHGTVVGISTKQKMNTRSSTESELVGVDEPLPMMLWSRLFAKAQGMPIDDNILYQDNISAIRMQHNGKASCTKRTKHIQIRYFYITDKVKSGEIKVEYCPTKEMIADFFTKPLTGSPFKKFRNIILGITDEDSQQYRRDYEKSTEERRLLHLSIAN